MSGFLPLIVSEPKLSCPSQCYTPFFIVNLSIKTSIMKEYNFKPVNAYQLDYDGETHYNLQINVGEEGLQEAEALFEEYDNYPNGPGWAGLVQYIMEQECPELISCFEFDEEGDTFLADCQEESNMIQLASLLQEIILNKDRLTSYLKELPEEYKYM